MSRREFTKSVKAEIVRRAMVGGTIFCEGCGLALKSFEIDHTIPDALILDKSRKLTAADGQLLGNCCHRGPDGKTNKDVKAIAKAKRVEAKHVGITRPKQSIQSQGFAKSNKPKRERPTVPPRQLYRSQ